MTAEFELLDNRDPEELELFYGYTAQPGRSFARQLFPNGPEGYVRATQLLGAYAINRAVALRIAGTDNNDERLMYLRIAEDVYNRLPRYAQWFVRKQVRSFDLSIIEHGNSKVGKNWTYLRAGQVRSLLPEPLAAVVLAPDFTELRVLWGHILYVVEPSLEA